MQERDKGVSKFLGGFARNRFNQMAAARGLDSEFIVVMAVAALAVFLLWWTPLLFPFRIFTTSAHEGGHALAAILMGGDVSRVQLNWNGSGLAMIRYQPGFIQSVIVYSAGYLGSVIFGGLLLLLAKRPQTRRVTLYAISGLLGVMAVLWMRDLESLALAGIGIALAGALAWKGPNWLVMFSIYVMALLSCLYSLMDLFFLTMSTSNPFGHGGNDAVFLATITNVPAFVWALAWTVLGGFMMFWFVKQAIRKPIPAASKNRFSAAKGDASAFDRYDDYLSKK